MDTMQFDQAIGENGVEHAAQIQTFLNELGGRGLEANPWIFWMIADALAVGYAIGRRDGYSVDNEAHGEDVDTTPFVHARKP